MYFLFQYGFLAKFSACLFPLTYLSYHKLFYNKYNNNNDNNNNNNKNSNKNITTTTNNKRNVFGILQRKP